MNKDEFTNHVLHLAVNEQHSLYVQDWGNPDAKVPIISLHGGPGGQSKDSHKGDYDPSKQRVIFYDQRGCGQSLPYGSLEDNTIDDLISDITAIADKLGIQKFVLKGQSWGSCLALAYGIKHPDRVIGMVIGGVFTGSKSEIDWLQNGLFETFYPDAWQNYLNETPKTHRGNPSAYHFDKVFNGNESEQKKSAFAYQSLEGSIIKLDDRTRQTDYEEYDPSGIKIELNYMKHNCFMPNNHILSNAYKLTMPITIIQGRYDMVCPPKTAFELHEQLPNSQLYTTLSGHASEHEDVQLKRQAISYLTN